MCSFRYPACNAHAPYCYLWPSTLYNIFPHNLTHGTIFGGGDYIKNKMCVFISSIFVWNIFHFKKNWMRCEQKCLLVFMLSPIYSCPILMKLEFFRQFFEKYSILNYMKICPVVPRGDTGGWTDMTKLIVAFRNLTNANKYEKYWDKF